MDLIIVMSLKGKHIVLDYNFKISAIKIKTLYFFILIIKISIN